MRSRVQAMSVWLLVGSLIACTNEVVEPESLISAQVSIVTPPAGNRILSLTGTLVNVGDTARLTVTIPPSTKEKKNTPAVRTFLSRNPAVADVSGTGLVTITGNGSAWLVLKLGGVLSDSLGLTVTSDVTPADSSSTPPPPPPSLVPPDGIFADTVSVMPTQATLPKRFVTHTYPVRTRTVLLKQGDNLQAAIDSARRGDEIILTDGATFKPVRLRKKAAAGWITIRSQSAPVAQGIRVTPAAAGKMAKIVTTQNAQPAIETDRGASGYWISGIEVATSSSVTLMYALVAIDAQSSVAADIPSNIVLDRMYVHGHDKLEIQRCVRFDVGNAAIVDSWISACHIHGFDSQAILVLTSPGQLLLRNNYLEGAGENVMLGGGAPSVVGMFPEDVEIVGNHFYKPLSWQAAGWTVKNLFEIKYGRRVDIRDNYFENNWVNAQAGTAILLRATDQEDSPWVRTSDLVFRRNVVANSAHGLSITADQMIGTNRVAVLSNQFRDIGMNTLGGNGGGRLVQLFGKLDDIEMRHNTMLFGMSGASGNAAIMMDGSGSQRLTIVNNIFDGGQYGIIRSGSGPGLPSLLAFASVNTLIGNALSLVGGGSYGSANVVVRSIAGLGLANPAAGDIRVTATSPIRNAGALGATPGVPNGSLTAAYAARSPK